MKSTQEQFEDKEDDIFVPSSKQIADTVGIPKTTFQRIRKQNQERRDLLKLQAEGSDSIPTGTVFSQVVLKSKGWKKLIKNLKRKLFHSLKIIQMLYRVQ